MVRVPANSYPFCCINCLISDWLPGRVSPAWLISTVNAVTSCSLELAVSRACCYKSVVTGEMFVNEKSLSHIRSLETYGSWLILEFLYHTWIVFDNTSISVKWVKWALGFVEENKECHHSLSLFKSFISDVASTHPVHCVWNEETVQTPIGLSVIVVLFVRIFSRNRKPQTFRF